MSERSVHRGFREYSMRIWLDPERLSHRSLIPADVVRAIQSQNLQVASGVVGQAPQSSKGDFQLTVKTLGRLIELGSLPTSSSRRARMAESFASSDVARIELGLPRLHDQ